MKIGSLFSGTGQLDEGVRAVIGGTVAWHVEFDPAPAKVLAHHYPGVPNHHDVTQVDWSTVEPVDVLTGGFPCQDLSQAGKRAGLKDGTRSGLWANYAHAIDVLRPTLVVIENVRGLLSARTGSSRTVEARGPKGGRQVGHTDRALGRVLADLADVGYDATWCGVRASDAGAPHQRFRVFIVAHPHVAGLEGCEPAWRRHLPDGEPATNAERGGLVGRTAWQRWSPIAVTRRRSVAPDAAHVGHERGGSARAGGAGPEDSGRTAAVDWGQYEPAIRRWEGLLNRPAPPPTELAPRGGQRLSPRFVEWLMGWPAGWVTDPAIGLSRNDQLKACGNGVVPQQAALATRAILSHIEKEVAA